MAPLSILPRLSGLGLLRHARLPLSTKASSNVPETGVIEPVRQGRSEMQSVLRRFHKGWTTLKTDI